MKKELAALALACALIPGVSMAAGKVPTSEKMMNDYDKYVVVYTSDEERIYADADTIERDPVSAGELPIIRATLYAEVYKHPPYLAGLWQLPHGGLHPPVRYGGGCRPAGTENQVQDSEQAGRGLYGRRQGSSLSRRPQ